MARKKRRPWVWMALLAGVAAAVLAVCMMLQPGADKPVQAILPDCAWETEADSCVVVGEASVQHARLPLASMLDGVRVKKTGRLPSGRVTWMILLSFPDETGGQIPVRELLQIESGAASAYILTVDDSLWRVTVGGAQLQALIDRLDEIGQAQTADPTGTYRTSEAHYMSALSSVLPPSGDDGKSYLLKSDTGTWGEHLRLTVVDDESGYEGSYDSTSSWMDLDTPGAPAWEDLFPAPENAPPIDRYALRQVRRLEGDYALFRLDAELWLGELWGVKEQTLRQAVRLDKISDEASLYALTKASVDKGTHACGRGWNAACGVIVLDLRQQACVLCLAGNAPAVPASPSEFFAEDKRRLVRQTRQVG